MRKSIMWVVATALASAMLTSAGGFSPAAARVFLTQCISMESACHRRCILSLNGMEANSATLYGLKICLNQCDGNFSACLDLAFSRATGKIDLSAGDGGPPKKRPAEAAPPAGILGSDPSLPGQGPARTGTPSGGGRIY